MSDSDDQAHAGTAEGQGPVRIDEELARHLANKREELFEEFEIRDGFPPEVLAEAEERAADPEGDIEDELEERRDLRELTTWTTDPADAQDFDDAISVRKTDEGYRLWVHIADVTHYVSPETAMWEEALERGNTVYLPGYTIHMLPPILAETVCSLVPNEDRLAHTVEMHIDGETLSHESIDIYKSVIHSDARQTYNDCEARLEDPDAPLHEENQLAYELAEKLHEQRKEDGSLVELLGEFVRQLVLRVQRGVGVLEPRLALGVRQAGVRMDDGLVDVDGLVGQRLAVDVHLDGVGQPVLVRDERAHRLGEDRRQHVDGVTREVDGVATL